MPLLSDHARRFPFLSILVVAGCILLVQAGIWWQLSRPRSIEPSWDGALESVSFAPFRKGQSPLDKIYPNAAELEEDIALAGTVARGIRTYTSREGMERLPDLARKHGIKMVHSAWLGREKQINDDEVAVLIRAANTHPDVIDRVIVGNEVLLRRDLKLEELTDYIDRVRSAISQPVSYADVWAFWLKNPSLADHVDFITIHVLPYWEDEPMPVEAMDRHFASILKEVRLAFPGKAIMIGEAGWPTEGRSRGPATASMENAARFVRLLPFLSKKYDFSYNVVEMFDQLWKSRLEGTIGARWGIFDAERRQKYPLKGAVEPIPDWRLKMGLALGMSVVLMIGFLRNIPEKTRGRTLVVYMALLNVMGVALAWSAFTIISLSFTIPWQIWALGRVAMLAICAGLVCWISRPWTDDKTAVMRAAYFLYLAYGVFAVVRALFFALDGRYRDLPSADFLVPVFGLAMLMLMKACRGRPHFGLAALTDGGPVTAVWRPQAQRFFWMLMLVAVLSPFGEGLAMMRGDDFIALHPTWNERLPLILAEMASNEAVLLWAAMLAFFAIPFGVDGFARHRRD